MEIFTLLKANIRYKKGSFISIVLLMIIIAMSLTTILSVKENCKNSHETALDEVNAGNITTFISTRRLTEELIHSVENHPLVEKMERYAAVCTDEAESGENSYGNPWLMTKLRSGCILKKKSRRKVMIRKISFSTYYFDYYFFDKGNGGLCCNVKNGR